MAGDYEYDEIQIQKEIEDLRTLQMLQSKLDPDSDEVPDSEPIVVQEGTDAKDTEKKKRPYPMYYVFFDTPQIVCRSKRELNKRIGKDLRKVKMIVRGIENEFKVKKVIDI